MDASGVSDDDASDARVAASIGVEREGRGEKPGASEVGATCEETGSPIAVFGAGDTSKITLGEQSPSTGATKLRAVDRIMRGRGAPGRPEMEKSGISNVLLESRPSGSVLSQTGILGPRSGQ